MNLRFLPRLGPAAAGIVCLLQAGCVSYYSDSGEDAIARGQITPVIDYSDPVLDQRKILVTTEINELTAREILEKLFHLDQVSHEPIDLYLNTPGGLLEQGVAVIDIIHTLRSPVNTHAIGNCSSAGAMILACATGRRTAYPSSVIAIHGAVEYGKVPPDYRRLSDQRIETLWKRHARLPAEWFPLKGKVVYFLTPERAVELGVIDAVTGD